MFINVRSFTLKIFMLFPIFTLLAFIPSITTILSIVGLGGMLFVLCWYGVEKKGFFLLISGAILSYWSYVNTAEPIINVNELIYFIYLIVFTVFIVSCKNYFIEYFKKNTIFIKRICLIWCALVIFSAVLPSSYDSGVFVSFAVTTFRLSPSAIFIMSLSSLLIVIKGKNKYIWYSIIPWSAIMFGASRTYLVIGTAMFMLNLSMICKDKKKYWLLVSGVVLLGILIIVNSSMGTKFVDSVTEHEYQDKLGVFTSGRSNFWVKDLAAFNKENLRNRIFGCGLNFIRIVNGAIIGTDENGIWAHNDFIQVVITYGYVGLAIYVLNMRLMFKEILTNRVPKFIHCLLWTIWFFNAMFNMYFTYICSMLALPMTILACEIYKQKNDKWFGEYRRL